MNSRSATLLSNLKRDTQALGHLISYSDVPFIPVRLDPNYVAACSLASNIVKKYVPTEQTVLKRTADAAKQLFCRMNDLCSRHTHSQARSNLVLEMRALAERELGTPMDWQDLLASSGLLVGAGASVSSHGRNSSYEKFFTNEMTTTNPFLYCEYLHYISKDASFHLAERHRRYKCGRAFKLVVGSTLSTVPKTDQIDRVICTEPSLNMLFQRSLAVYFDHQLRKYYGYDAALQPDRNRHLARIGSIYNTIGTIDLSSASDTISRDLLREILPDWLNIAIDDCRSNVTIIDGTKLNLNMFATMGNGFTFSVQTYVFSLLMRALCRIHSIPFVRFDKIKTMGVFGDDIIVPSHLFDRMIAGLEILGFIPNKSKSFNHGYFRESCGSDWYDGVNVRAVYIKSLASLNDRFSAFNRLAKFCSLHEIGCYHILSGLLPTHNVLFSIPTDESDDAGIKTPVSPYLNRYGLFRYRAFRPVTNKIGILIKRNLDPLDRKSVV